MYAKLCIITRTPIPTAGAQSAPAATRHTREPTGYFTDNCRNCFNHLNYPYLNIRTSHRHMKPMSSFAHYGMVNIEGKAEEKARCSGFSVYAWIEHAIVHSNISTHVHHLDQNSIFLASLWHNCLHASNLYGYKYMDTWICNVKIKKQTCFVECRIGIIHIHHSQYEFL